MEIKDLVVSILHECGETLLKLIGVMFVKDGAGLGDFFVFTVEDAYKPENI